MKQPQPRRTAWERRYLSYNKKEKVRIAKKYEVMRIAREMKRRQKRLGIFDDYGA